MFTTPQFRYFIVQKGDYEGGSHFSGFSSSWLNAAPTIADILRLPANLLDVIDDSERSVGVRVQGYSKHSVAIIQPEWLNDSRTVRMMILVSDSRSIEAAIDFCSRADEPVLHLTASESDDITRLSTVTIADYEKWLLELAEYEQGTGLPGGGDLGFIIANRKRNHRVIASEVGANSGAELAARYALASCALDLPPLSEPHQPLSQSYRSVRERRRRFEDKRFYLPGTTELLIKITSLPKTIRATDIAGTPVSAPGQRVFEAIIDGAQVSGDPRQAAFDLTGTTDSDAVAICRERAAELQGLLVATCLEATAQFVPTIEIPSFYPLIRQKVERLSGTIRSSTQSSYGTKAGRLVNEIGASIAAHLPPEVLNAIRDTTGTIKVVGDEPLELLRIEGVPLPLRCNIVRLPTSPGFVLERQLQLSEPLSLFPKDFAEILILRTAAPSDPIYSVLERFAKAAEQIGNIRLLLKDIGTSKHLIDALEDFDGSLVVLDGHGKHDFASGGRLQIHNHTFDPWTISNRVKMPPLFFLAACDTHPFDRREDSTAAAILANGARCVFGTFSTVGAVESSMLFSQLLYCLTVVLPACPAPVRLSELFGVALRTAFLYEVAYLRWPKRVKVQQDAFKYIVKETARLIRGFNRGWWDYFLSDIAENAGLQKADVEDRLSGAIGYPDALLHCQLGNPDSVFLMPTADWWDAELKRKGWTDGMGAFSDVIRS